MSLAYIVAKRNAKHGIADSQLFMGRWTPEFYEERCRVFEAEFKQELQQLYPKRDSQEDLQ